MKKVVRPEKLEYILLKENPPRGILTPSGRRKKPSYPASRIRSQARRQGNCVLVIGETNNYWIRIKQARALLRDNLVFKISSKPFLLQEKPTIERVFSSLVCRRLRIHRAELIRQILKAKHLPWRDEQITPENNNGYIPLPFGFGRDLDKTENEKISNGGKIKQKG